MIKPNSLNSPILLAQGQRVRLHVLADLHQEFEAIAIPHVEADVIVLAGDIGQGDHGLEWIRKQWPDQPVVYVMGNHEFYHQSFPELVETLQQQAAGTSIHVLENQAVEICGLTFLGCTLWTGFSEEMDPVAAHRRVEMLMTDYHVIRQGPEQHLLRTRHTIKHHRESLAWLRAELRRHDPKQTVVVTHHAPSLRSEAPYHRGGALSPAFCSDLDDIVESSGVPLWIHGHTHYNVDYRLGATRMLTNQRGYPDALCYGFDPEMVVEV